MHAEPYLAAFLSKQARRAAELAVDNEDVLVPAAVDRICDELTAELIKLGQPEWLEQPWVRRMSAGNEPSSLILQGIYPGQSYDVSYARYRLPIVSGSRYIAVGVNGGRYIDPMFALHRGGHIEIRAHDDGHRNELIADIRVHIDRANGIISKWNNNSLRPLVESLIERKRIAESAADSRRKQLEADGFAPASQSQAPERVPLPDKKRHRRPPAKSNSQKTDGTPYALTAGQLADVLDCIATHQDAVERLPGAGAPAAAAEDHHRDALLAALNTRFAGGTAESFSKRGKTDIRLEVDDNSYFYAECKIWDGPATVDDAVEQLLERYLTYRDSYGALVFFVRDRANPRELPTKALDRLADQHNGKRSSDVGNYPVVTVPVPAKAHAVDLALIFIVVDEATPHH